MLLRKPSVIAISFLLFVPISSIADNLPSKKCNDYSVNQGSILAKSHGVKFNPVSEILFKGKISKVDNWDQSVFYNALSMACYFGETYVKEDSQEESINTVLKTGLYESMRTSTYGKIPAGVLIEATKNAVVYGRSIGK